MNPGRNPQQFLPEVGLPDFCCGIHAELYWKVRVEKFRRDHQTGQGKMKQPTSIFHSGSDQPPPQQTELRAGPLSLLFEAGDLRYIRLGNSEILRRIYVAIRDHNWDTIAPKLSNVEMDVRPDSFQIRYDVENRQADLDFAWQGIISGDARGTVDFKMQGQARSTFRRNRIGFCVLHPMACAGLAAKIEHVDGTFEETFFPKLIAQQLVKDGHPWPVAPFDNMRALSHQVLPNLWVEVRFEGDIFEMEDQRNWTDASYKTYCTPLSEPFPVEIAAGTKITQSIRLSLSGEQPAVSTDEKQRELTLFIGDGPDAPLPDLGLGVASHGRPLTTREIDRLSRLHPSHLRVDLSLSDPAYRAKLLQASSEARALGAGLEVALFLSDNAQAELDDLAGFLVEEKSPVLRWLVFHHQEKTTTARWVELARGRLSGHGIPIGAGTNVYFTELNSQRPPVEALDVVAYSLNPQVHAVDNSSLVETLAAQAVTVESARQIVGDRSLVVSPVTLRPRFNPNATGPEPEPEPDRLPAPGRRAPDVAFWRRLDRGQPKISPGKRPAERDDF